MENSQLLEHIGETKTKKLIDSIQSEYKELQRKQFPKSENLTKTCCVVSVLEKNETEIKSIGMSCVNDLFLDNWGLFLAVLLGGQGGFFSFRQISNVGQNMFVVRNLTKYNETSGAVGAKVQIGQGSTPPTRSDFAIDSAFASSPENSLQNVGTASYQVGLSKITIPIQITPTGGSGSIAEAVLFGQWVQQGTNTIQSFALSRDLISPVVGFVNGQSINLDYGILLN